MEYAPTSSEIIIKPKSNSEVELSFRKNEQCLLISVFPNKDLSATVFASLDPSDPPIAGWVTYRGYSVQMQKEDAIVIGLTAFDRFDKSQQKDSLFTEAKQLFFKAIERAKKQSV